MIPITRNPLLLRLRAMPHRSEESRSVVKGTQLLVNVSLLLLSTLAALGIAEAYFRLFNPQSIVPRYVEVSEYGIRKNIANVHGVMSTSEYRHRFNTNSQGFRGRAEYAPAKPSGLYRIIVLGDSVALGHGVEDNETFAAVAERELRRARPVEVINMGVSGFGTAEELIQLQYSGWLYQTDLVVLAYFPNDPYNNIVSQLFSAEDGRLVRSAESFVPALYVRDRLSSIPGYSYLCDHSHVVNFLRGRTSAFFLDHLGRQHHTSSDPSSVLTEEEARLTGLLLRRMAEESVERKVPLLVLNIPVILKGRLIENFPEASIWSVDTSTIVLNVAREAYQGHSFDELSYAHDSHPKPYGHRLIARELVRVIQDRVWADR